ncbi:type VII secretion protein EccC [Bifidobacterium animalis subsp. animalis]|nr:type VII secretion protein EccC [Bifidobacterium animalis subsp. animalis]
MNGDSKTERLQGPAMPKGRIVLQSPPELEASDGMNTLLTSMVPLLGSVSAIVMMLMTNSGLTGLLTGGMFMLSSMGFVVVNGVRQRSQRMANLTASRREYLTYLSQTRKAVRTAASKQRSAALWNAPDPHALIPISSEPARRWERLSSDEDFMVLRIGTHEEDLALTLEAPEIPPLAQLDPVSASAAHRFLVAHSRLRNMPFSIDMRRYKRVEMLGGTEQVHALARSLLAQAATWHAPEDLRIAVLATPDRMAEWEWVRMLPHSWTDGDPSAHEYLVTSHVHDMDSLLGEQITSRGVFTAGAYSPGPHVLVVNDGYDVGELGRQTRIFDEAGLDGVTVIDMPDSWGELSEQHVMRMLFSETMVEHGLNVVETSLDTGVVQLSSIQMQHSIELKSDALSLGESQAVARRLCDAVMNEEAEIRDESAQSHRKSNELPALVGIDDIRHIDLERLWRYRTGASRLNVPIGVYDDMTTAMLDLKEMGQHGMGPHGVLVGATGSGKSEVLRTLVLSLALTHSPDQLNFVLIDFKGGATFAGMEGMPHISSIITNLGREASLVERMEDALDGEINRRQELLRDAGNLANITEYEEARVKGGRSDLDPLPSLVIVVDEFSELLKAKDDIVQSFVRIGAVGRSLGIHLLIASQRLEQGKLRGLDEHLSYRIGLKTFSASESRTVLGVTDAFELPSLPGIGFLKTPAGTMSRFRASYVSGVPHELENSGSNATTFEIAVDQMRGKGRPAHVVWLPTLDTPNTLDEFMDDLQVVPGLGFISPRWRKAGALVAPCALEDRPREQKREIMAIDLSGAGGHVAVVGGPLSGKSMLLRTIVTSVALSHTPLETQFYVVDCGGGSFASLESLAHVAGVCARNEEEKVRRTIAEVGGLIDRRERFFKEHAIDGMDAYRRRRAMGEVDDGYGDVFLVIDGWGNFRADYEELEAKVQQITARGLAFGVHVMLGASRWMEIRANISDLIGTKLELRLGDEGDSQIDRRVAAAVPRNMPGRGVSPSALHSMAALPRIDGNPDLASMSQGVADLIDKVNTAWDGPKPPKLRLLPTLLDYSEVVQALPGSNGGEQAPEGLLFLGIDENGLEPVIAQTESSPHMYVFGESKSGKSSFLRLMIREIERSYAPNRAKIFMVDYRRANLGELSDSHTGAYITTEEDAIAQFAELAEYLKTRKPGPDVTAEQLRDRSWWTGSDVFVLVDDYDLVVPKSGANPLAPLVPLLAQANDVGLHVMLTRRTGGASRAMYDPVLQAMQDLDMTGILLSGDPNEGQLIGRVKPKRAVAGRAQIVTRDEGLFVAQLAFAPPRQ